MGLHWYDLVGLVLIGLLIFGPKRLPEIGSSMGKTIREFQKSMREVTNPERPSSESPSALQTPQAAADVAPVIAPAAIAPAAPVAETPTAVAPADAGDERAEMSAETSAETGTEPGAATLVGEDSVR